MDFQIEMSTLEGLNNQRFRIEGTSKSHFSLKLLFMNFVVDVLSLFGVLGAVCLVFYVLKTSLKSAGFLMENRIRVGDLPERINV